MTFPAPSDELPQQCYIDEAIVVTALKTQPKSQRLKFLQSLPNCLNTVDSCYLDLAYLE